MKVLVTGGTGTLGGAFVETAVDGGHSVRILSRSSRPEGRSDAIEWTKGDLAAGEGISEAVRGVDAVLHAATSPGLGTEKVDVEGTRQLVEASEAAEVEHFIYPSIVGIDEIPFSYYQHKLSAEHLIEEAAIPHTILRATQFHEFVDQIISAAMRLPFAAVLPTDFQVQSVAAVEVAERLDRCLDESPSGRLPDFGGPEVNRLGELAHTWMEAKQKHKRLLRLPLPGRVARAFREGKNTDPGRKAGKMTWRAWLHELEEREAG